MGTLAPPVVERPVNPEAGAESTTTSVAVVAPASAADNGTTAAWLIGIGIVALIAAWLAWMPRLARAWGRHRSDAAADRVAAAWRRACGVLRVAGAPATGGTTPIEYSRLVERETGIDQRVVGELARTVTRAVYAPDGVDEAAARRSEQLEQQIDEICQPMIPLSTRILARLDPRIARATG